MENKTKSKRSRGIKMKVTNLEYAKLSRLEADGTTADYERILGAHRAARILSASFHGTPINVIITDEK